MSVRDIHELYRRGDLEGAENKLASHILRNPGDPAALHLGALVATQRGDLRTALARIRASLRDMANAHEKLNSQGNILAGLGSLVDAQTSFEAALTARPGYAPALGNLAKLQLLTDQPVDAAETFRDLIALDADNAGAWHGRLHTLIESHQLDTAEAELVDAPLSDAERAGYRARLAFYRDDAERVLGQARQALGTADGASALSLALQTLAMTGGWELAPSLIADALAAYPDRADLHASAMRSLHKAGDDDGAVAIFERSPEDPDVFTVRADMANAAGDYAEAEDFATQALNLRKGYAPAVKAMCVAALGQGNPQLAQQVADLGLQANPNDQFYYAVKATAGRARGQDYGFYFNYDRFVRAYDLQAPEGWSDMDAFNADLKAELDGLHGFEGAPLDQTLRMGTQTAPDLRFVDSPAIQAFFGAVDPAIRKYLEDIRGDADADRRHAFLRRNIGGYRIRSAWSVRLGEGGHHVDHIHPEGWISSAYYVDVPPAKGREGWIKFGEPPAPLNAALGQDAEHEVEPRAGRLVLFPSYMWHGTRPITGALTRLTLPIDIVPAKPA